MEDLDKNFDENENQVNKDFFDTDEDDNKINEDVQTSAQESEKRFEVEEESNEKEEASAFEQGEMHSQQREDYQEKNRADNIGQQQYSSYYTPPYYVPNFTINDSNDQSNSNYNAGEYAQKNKNGQAWKTAFIVCLVSLIVLLVFSLGVLLLLENKAEDIKKRDENIDMGDETLNIVQNAPKVEITTNTDLDYIPQSLPEVVSKVGNSVVEIKTSSRVFDRFYGQYVTSGAGSGVIITQSEDAGYLLTNYHVIYNDNDTLADTITVVLTNGEEYTATEIGNDESLDLAVLRIEKKQKETFTVAAFGDSSKLVVGQEVIAIGNPLGSLGGTVTDGIISALDRQVKIDTFTMTLLQHNAAINPGNSGGALFDMMGNLIGIVNAKTSDTGIEGLGFAIPSNIAMGFFNRVMVTEPAIGIKVAYGRPDERHAWGVYVVKVTNNDFKLYDRIVKVNGEKVDTTAEYYAAIDSFKNEETMTVTVQRKGATVEIKVALSE